MGFAKSLKIFAVFIFSKFTSHNFYVFIFFLYIIGLKSLISIALLFS